MGNAMGTGPRAGLVGCSLLGLASLARLGRGISPSMSLFYHADARSAGEQIERAGYGRAGMHGGSLYDVKGFPL